MQERKSKPNNSIFYLSIVFILAFSIFATSASAYTQLSTLIVNVTNSTNNVRYIENLYMGNNQPYFSIGNQNGFTSIWYTPIPPNATMMGVTFNISSDPSNYLLNPWIDVCNDSTHEWNYTGIFNQSNNRTQDISSSVQSCLSACSLFDDYGNCYLPIVLHSDDAGGNNELMTITDINFTYDYNVSMLFKSSTNSGNYYWNQTSGLIAGTSYKKIFNVTNSTNSFGMELNITGYYLLNQSATACYVNNVQYAPTGSPLYCPCFDREDPVGICTPFCSYFPVVWRKVNISDTLSVPVTITETSYSQDLTKQAEAGSSNYSYIYSIVNLTNPSDTGELLAGNYSRSARSNWTCDSGCSYTFSLSDGVSINRTTNQSKINAITKIEKNTTLDTAFQSQLLVNTSINNNVSWYYWNTTLELNNTDSIVNYTNVNWRNYLAGANFSYAENISNGTISQLNYTNASNVTSRYRTPSALATESVTNSSGIYEKDIIVTCSNSIDGAFISSYYKSMGTNVTIDSSYTNYNLYWWNGAAWELHTNTLFYNFTLAGANSWAYFKTNCSTEYYAVVSSTMIPSYTPPIIQQPGGGGSTTTIKIVSGNWSILQPDYYLLVAPGTDYTGSITIDNKMNDKIEYVDMTCVPSVCKTDDPCMCVNICQYVTFAEKLVEVEGRPAFQVYQIPTGQSGKVGFVVNFTDAYAINNSLMPIQSCNYQFSVNVSINGESHPINVHVIAFPGGEKLGNFFSWLQKKTLVIPGRYPIYLSNWLIAIIIVIAAILMPFAIYRMLRSKNKKKAYLYNY